MFLRLNEAQFQGAGRRRSVISRHLPYGTQIRETQLRTATGGQALEARHRPNRRGTSSRQQSVQGPLQKRNAICERRFHFQSASVLLLDYRARTNVDANAIVRPNRQDQGRIPNMNKQGNDQARIRDRHDHVYRANLRLGCLTMMINFPTKMMTTQTPMATKKRTHS
jgi:hypothetical protein